MLNNLFYFYTAQYLFYGLLDIIYLMAQKTISIYPISKGVTIEQIQNQFSQYNIQKIGLVAEKSTAYLQFAKASDIQALSNKYPQCKVPNLNDSQIGFVQNQFKWPVAKTTAKAETLVLIKKCDKINEISQEKIRQIFKLFAVQRIVKFQSTKEIVLQFYSQDELQLLELNFDDLKVPQLGPNAQIDIENQFPVERFVQKYLELNQVYEVAAGPRQKKEIIKNTSVSPVKKEEIVEMRQSDKIEKYARSKEQQRKNKQEQNKRKMEQMEREILEKEKARQSAIQKFQKERRQEQERLRIQRQQKQNKQKQRLERERKQRQARERKEQQQKQRRLKEQRQKLQQKEKELQRLQNETKVKKLQEERQKESLQRQLADRISKVKKQVQQEQKRFIRPQEKVEEERQLQQMLAQQKQRINKKQINLPQIIKTNTNQSKKDEKIAQLDNKPIKVKRPLAVGNYKDISTRFITFVAFIWIYYVWIS